nr:potassium channel family protein [uncultured Cetobacterium sp.]
MNSYKKEQLINFIKTSILAMIISIVLSILAHFFMEEKFVLIKALFSAIKIFFSILPIVILRKKNFLFKDGPLKATLLILYYLILVPFVNITLGLDTGDDLKYFFYFLSFINVVLLMVSHVILLKYVITDFLRKKRQVAAGDVTIIITTYITIAISFGLLYTILSLFSSTQAFNGIPSTLPSFEFYFKHIYFSFITITTVGYGDVYPLTTLGEFLVLIEIITGILLTNVILGLVIGSGILVNKK